MLRSQWFRNILGLSSRNARRRQASQNRRFTRLQLEGLEDRLTPSATMLDVANANELQAAINTQVNANPTQQYVLNLTGSTYNLEDIHNQLTISNSAGVTLEGNGATLNAALNNRLFLINAGSDVIFKDMTLQGGKVSASGDDAQGGAIKDIGGKVTLSNVSVQNNTVQSSNNHYAKGGGVYVSAGGTLTVQGGSHIQNNNALGFTVNGMDGNAQGGGVYLTGASAMNLFDSSLSSNKAQGGDATTGTAGDAYGGGIYSHGATNLNIRGSHLDGNRALGGNGIVTAAGQGGAFGADGRGGGVYLLGDGWTVTIADSTLNDNQATGGFGATGQAGNAGGNGGYASGAGAWFDGAGLAVKMESTSMTGNTAQGGAGGHGGIDGGAGGNGGSVYGGALDFEGSSALWTILNSRFADNHILGGAGGRGATGSTGANGGDGGKGGYGGNAKGGGIEFYNDPASAAITNSSFTGNTSTGGKGGDGGSGGLGGNAGTGGKGGGGGQGGEGRGGGIDVYDNFPLTLINTTLGANVAQGGNAGAAGSGGGGGTQGAAGALGAAGNAYGGGLRDEVFGKTTLINSTVAFNQALAGAGGLTNASGSGGGIFGTGTLLTNTILTNNVATTKGADFAGNANGLSDYNFIGDSNGSTGLFGPHSFVDNVFLQYGNPLGALSTANGVSYYPLLANSIVINTGTNSVLGAIASAENHTNPTNAVDAIGAPRILNTRIDMGAVEFGVAATSTTVNPVVISTSAYPTQVQLTAHVTSATGEIVEEGLVTFTLTDEAGNLVGSAVSNVSVVHGVASAPFFTVPGNTPAGSYRIKASYSDPATGAVNGRYGASEGTGTLSLNATVSGTALVVGSASVNQSGSPQTTGIVVLVNSPSGAVNGGTVTVTLLQNGNPLVQASGQVSNGSANVSLTVPANLPVGSYQLQQAYHDGSGTFGDTSGFGTLTVNGALPNSPPADQAATPTPAAPSLFQAVFTLYVNAIHMVLNQHGFGAQFGLPSQSDLLASINHHLPYAGPFGIQALIAGVNAANEALGKSAS